MSGIPLDLLVDIDGSYDSIISPQSFNNFQSNSIHDDDDPFELCSMQSRASKKDLGLELGLALEKSIKLRSQSNQTENTAATPVNSEKADLGILVNLEDSPDKKFINSSNPNLASVREADSVFTHTSSNPFELAWDVIEQEALTLANHIQHDKEKPISPRKMVDLAMKLSPDSLLLSPRNNNRDEEFLIHSSPEQEMKKTATKPVVRGRLSMGSSPIVARSYATPLRSRPSLAPSNYSSPMRKMSKLVAPSPAKQLLQKSTFKAPLLRSSSATTPLNQIPGSTKMPVSRAAPVPLKATHQTQAPQPPAVRAPLKSTSDTTKSTPVRRSLGVPSVSAGAVPPVKGSFQSKLKTPLNRAEEDSQKPTGNKAPEINRPSSSRFGSKRALTSSTSSSAASSSQSSRYTIGGRIKAKGRENIEP